jgi:hypothetical protein
MSESDKLRKVGALWRPKPDAKSLGSGSLTINGMRQRFVVLVNPYKEPGNRQPDYILMSADEPEPDEYAAAKADEECGAPALPISDSMPF